MRAGGPRGARRPGGRAGDAFGGPCSFMALGWGALKRGHPNVDPRAADYPLIPALNCRSLGRGRAVADRVPVSVGVSY